MRTTGWPGRPIATYTSCGPGSVNIMMAVAGAMYDSSAMLAITGNVPTSQFNRGPFQESGKYFQGDFPGAIRHYVKRSFQAVRPEMLPLMLSQAFALMTSGRPGPVNLDVPLNVFVEEVGEDAAVPVWRPEAVEPPAPSAQALRQAAELLAVAERPVIVAGGGARPRGPGRSSVSWPRRCASRSSRRRSARACSTRRTTCASARPAGTARTPRTRRPAAPT